MRIVILLFALFAGLPALGAQSQKPDLNTLKQLFDKGLVNVEVNASPSCRGEGMRCSSSFQCCKGFCQDDACHDIGGGCRGEGARCSSGLECCKGFCNDSLCHDIGSGCRQEGAACNNSLDCCGSNFCRDGYCQ